MPETTAAASSTEATAAATSTTAAAVTATETGAATTATASTAQATGDQATTATTATPATAAAPAAKTEVDYTDFKAPDGYTLSPELASQFKDTAKKFGLNQEQAQELVDMDAKRTLGQVQALHQITADWQNQSKADKEIGGDAIDANMATAKKALDTFGSPALSKMLHDSGLGNHPEIIRAFYKVGKAISEDGFVSADKGHNGNDARKLFPNSSMNA